MRKFEEIRALLALKFSKEKKRLKTYGTKANSFDLANSVARFVIALMCESRYRELKRVKKKFNPKYLKERLQATKAMTKVLQDFAEEMEKKRPYKFKKVKKHEHHESKHHHR